jgi:hypothetical protein
VSFKEQASGNTIKFICNSRQVTSDKQIIYQQSNGGSNYDGDGDDEIVHWNHEILFLSLATPTPDSIFNMNLWVDGFGPEFSFRQPNIGLFGLSYESCALSQMNGILNSNASGQLIIDSIISNGKKYKNLSCYYQIRNSTWLQDSLYTSPGEGIIRLVLGTEGKILMK